MLKKYGIVFILFSLLLLQACSGDTFMEDNRDFIRVDGTHFTLDGEPYYFSGANYWYGCYIGSPGETGDRERLKRELDFLKEAGITNLRILAASEESEIQNSLTPAFQTSPGEYNEELLQGLDYLLAEMGKRKMHAVVFLHNFWEWSGGFSQYNAWFGDGTLLDPASPEFDWPVYGNWVAEFYRNEEAVRHHREYVEMIINRRNTITGEHYYDDPAIMAWQLCNEPRPGVGEEAVPHLDAFYGWIDKTAAFIKSLDGNHLVTTGNEGVMGSIGREDVYLEAHNGPDIDYATFHLWAKNWGWFKADDMEGTFPATRENATEYVNRHIELAKQLGKPITLEEFGLGRDFEETDPSTATTYRDKYFRLIFNLVADSAAAGAPIAGTNIWTWGGEARARHEDAKWRPGDPFTGDPPQEPQGLNSVFEGDQSTIEVLKEFGARMRALRRQQVIGK